MKADRAQKLRHSLLLLATAAIWGVAFVAQSVGTKYVGPFTFTAIRFALGVLVLLPVIFLQKNHRRDDGRATGGRLLFKAGVLCGIALGTASMIQQIGIGYTTVGKAGFITAMYIVLVPVFAAVTGRKAGPVIWICVGTAAAGLYFLSIDGGALSVQKGDAICLLCAAAYAVQILLVDHYVDMVDGIRLAALQFLTAAMLSAALMIMFERPSAVAIKAAWIPLLYTGILSSGAAYTFQIIGQRGLNPTVASLLMSLESTFSALAGFFILHQKMTGRELAGCALMACAIVLAQLKGSGGTGTAENQS